MRTNFRHMRGKKKQPNISDTYLAGRRINIIVLFLDLNVVISPGTLNLYHFLMNFVLLSLSFYVNSTHLGSTQHIHICAGNARIKGCMRKDEFRTTFVLEIC